MLQFFVHSGAVQIIWRVKTMTVITILIKYYKILDLDLLESILLE